MHQVRCQTQRFNAGQFQRRKKLRAVLRLAMKIGFTARDLEIATAWREFRSIMESDIRSAAEPAQARQPPSEAAMALYDELVR